MPLSSPVLSARRGEVHWTKVLQANFIPPPGYSSSDGSSTKAAARSRGQNLSNPGKTNRKKKAAKRWLSAGSANKLSNQSSENNTKKHGNILVRLYAKVVQWISPSHKTSKKDVRPDVSSHCENVPNYHYQERCKSCRELNERVSGLSTFQGLYGIGCDEVDCKNWREFNRDSGFTSPLCLTGESSPCTSSDISFDSQITDIGDRTSELASRTYSWPTTVRRKAPSEQDGYIDWEEALIDPTLGEDTGWENEEEFPADRHCDYSIPYSDLQMKDCIKRTCNHHIYRGNWHGDVIIHQFIDVSDDQMEPFWENLNQLSKIRHENIILFMGACVQLPHLAIVTSGHRGKSLYQHIHINGEVLPVQTKVNILRQVIRGLGYLHARGVVMGALNSRNIILDTRVKLSLLDTSMADSKYHRLDRAIVARGFVTYLPPEQIRTLTVAPPCVQLTAPNEQEGDVFAFGTVLYEILCGAFPFSGQTTECIVYRVGRGHTQSTSHLRCSSRLKNLNKRCWSHSKHHRPTCAELNQTLNQNFGLHKKHSSSVPERVDQLTKGKIS